MRTIFLILLAVFVAFGCAASNEGGTADQPARGETADNGPVAYVGGNNAVYLEDLRPALLEARGAEVLADYIIDRGVAERLAQRGITLTDADLEAERLVLLEMLSPDADTAARLLRELRSVRGLGEQRFAAMIRRSAGLRKLVEGEVNITDDAVRIEYDRLYGVRYEARLIMVPSVQQAGEMLDRLNRGESFIDLAIAHSTDQSRAQGGLLPLISPLDTTFPAEIRKAVEQLQPGQVSQPIALENQWAILKLEGKIEAAPPPFDEVKERIALALRRGAERVVQGTLAREIVSQANVLVMDPALSRSWKLRMEQMRE